MATVRRRHWLSSPAVALLMSALVAGCWTDRSNVYDLWVQNSSDQPVVILTGSKPTDDPSQLLAYVAPPDGITRRIQQVGLYGQDPSSTAVVFVWRLDCTEIGKVTVSGGRWLLSVPPARPPSVIAIARDASDPPSEELVGGGPACTYSTEHSGPLRDPATT